MDRKQLEGVWEQVHPDLEYDDEHSPLHAAIIQEGINGGEEDPKGIAEALYRLAEDIEEFADGVCAAAQGFTPQVSRRAIPVKEEAS